MTELLFREDAYRREASAVVVETLEEGLVLDRTLFYATAGGQPCDTGVLELDDGRLLPVVDARKDGDCHRPCPRTRDRRAAPRLRGPHANRLGPASSAHAHPYLPPSSVPRRRWHRHRWSGGRAARAPRLRYSGADAREGGLDGAASRLDRRGSRGPRSLDRRCRAGRAPRAGAHHVRPAAARPGPYQAGRDRGASISRPAAAPTFAARRRSVSSPSPRSRRRGVRTGASS